MRRNATECAFAYVIFFCWIVVGTIYIRKPFSNAPLFLGSLIPKNVILLPAYVTRGRVPSLL
jgi:hypothetical protein